MLVNLGIHPNLPKLSEIRDIDASHPSPKLLRVYRTLLYSRSRFVVMEDVIVLSYSHIPKYVFCAEFLFSGFLLCSNWSPLAELSSSSTPTAIDMFLLDIGFRVEA